MFGFKWEIRSATFNKRKAVVMKKCLDWAGVLFFACLLICTWVVMEHNVLSRTTVTVGEQIWSVSVMRNHSLAVGNNGYFATTLFVKDGEVLTRHGILGGKGRMPVTYTVEAKPEEVSLYRKFFPR